MLLSGKTAVITGGTRGIGFAAVKKFLEEGANVALFGSRKETVDKAMAEIADWEQDYDVMGLYPSLTDASEVENAFKEVKERFGSIDILINNAGISASDTFYDYKPEDFERIIDINVKGVFLCAHAAAPYMKEEGGGSIINTSSVVSLYGQPGGVGYPTSKFAVNGFTKALARELGKDNIRVNAVAPGITRTDMVSALTPEMIQPLIDNIPLRRVGEPEDIANAFLYLASDLASYVSGTVLSVDGAVII